MFLSERQTRTGEAAERNKDDPSFFDQSFPGKNERNCIYKKELAKFKTAKHGIRPFIRKQKLSETLKRYIELVFGHMSHLIFLLDFFREFENRRCF